MAGPATSAADVDWLAVGVGVSLGDVVAADGVVADGDGVVEDSAADGEALDADAAVAIEVVLAAGAAPGGQPAGQSLGGHRADGGNFVGTHRRRTDLQFRHAGLGQPARDRQLLRRRKSHTRGLLPVAECGVDKLDAGDS